MENKKFSIILFYKYVPIENPEALMLQQKELCKKLGLTGRMIIAKEGINGTFEGPAKLVSEYVEDLMSRPEFSDIHIKRSEGTGKAFPRLSIKVRNEIVASYLGEKDIDPRKVTGKYLQAEELHEWIHGSNASTSLSKKSAEPKQFYIVDMRNDYEFAVGRFENSLFPNLTNFRDLKHVLPILDSLKDKTIVTVCTGGVRCEKASGFLVANGFNDVYQLYGGIVTYMEKYPGEDFLGSLYVFDNRIVMAFNMDDPNRSVVGICSKCEKKSENYINCTDPFCHRHFIVCKECLNGKETMRCPMGCRDFSKEHPETAKGLGHSA